MTSLPRPFPSVPTRGAGSEEGLSESQKAFLRMMRQRKAQEELQGERQFREQAGKVVVDTPVEPNPLGDIYNPARPFDARPGFWEGIEEIRKLKTELVTQAAERSASTEWGASHKGKGDTGALPSMEEQKIDEVINNLIEEERALVTQRPYEQPDFLEGLRLRFQAALTAPFKYDYKGMPQYSDDPAERVGDVALAALNVADVGTTILAPFKSFSGLLGAAAAFGKDNLVYSAVGEAVRQIIPGKGSRVGVLPGTVPVGAGQARFGSDILDEVFGWEEDPSKPSLLRAGAEILTELAVFRTIQGVGRGITKQGYDIARSHTARSAVGNVISELAATGDTKAAESLAVTFKRFMEGRLAWDDVLRKAKDEISKSKIPLQKEWDDVLSDPLVKDISRWDVKSGTYNTVVSGQAAWGPTTDIITKQDILTLPALLASKLGWSWPRKFLQRHSGRTLLPAFIARGETSLMERLQAMWQGSFGRAGLKSTPNRGQAVRMADVFGNDEAAAGFRSVLEATDPGSTKVREAWQQVVNGLKLHEVQGLLGRSDVVETTLGLGRMSAVQQFDIIRSSMASRIAAEQELERIVAPLNAKVGPVLKRLDDLDASLRAAITGGASEGEIAFFQSQIYELNKTKDRIINSPKLEKFFQQNPEFRFMVKAPVATEATMRIPRAGERVTEAERLTGVKSGRTFIGGESRIIPTSASEGRSVRWSPAVARERLFGEMARLTGDEQIMERWANRIIELNGAINDPIPVLTRGKAGLMEGLAAGFAKRGGLPEEVLAWKNHANAVGAHEIEEALETLQGIDEKFARLPSDAQQIVTDAYNLSINRLRLLGGPNAPTPDKVEMLRNLSHRAINAVKRYANDAEGMAERLKDVRRIVAMPGGKLTDDMTIKGLAPRIDEIMFENWSRMVVPSGGRRWIRPARSSNAGDEIVFVRASEFDQAWQRSDKITHVGPKGKGGSPGKYEGFQSWLAKDNLNEMPEVFVGPNATVQFKNGRHRFAVIRDSDPNAIIPVAVPKGTGPVPGEIERVKPPTASRNLLEQRAKFNIWKAENRLIVGEPKERLPVEYHLRGKRDPGVAPSKWTEGDYTVNLLGPAGMQQAAAKQALAELMASVRGAVDEINELRFHIIRQGTPQARLLIAELDEYMDQLQRKELAMNVHSYPGAPAFSEIDAQGRKLIIADFGRKQEFASLFQDDAGHMLTPGEINEKLMAGGNLPYDLVQQIESSPEMLRKFRNSGSNAAFLFSEDPIARALGRTLQASNAKTAADVMDVTLDNLAWRIPIKGLTRQKTTASIAELMAHYRDPVIVQRVGSSKIRMLDIDGALDARNKNPNALLYVMDRRVANSIDESVQTVWDVLAASFRTFGDSSLFTSQFGALNRAFKTTVTFAPGFHARNFIQGVLVNYLVGTTPTDIMLAAAAKLTPNRVVVTATGPMRLGDLVKEYAESGATKSLFSQVVPKGAVEADIATVKRVMLPSKDRRVARALTGQGIQRWLSQKIEDSIRLPAYLHFRRTGLDKVYAANKVNHYFFDYGNMTKFERNVVSAFMPWYPWFRNVVGFTLKEAVSNPTTLIRYAGAIATAKNFSRELIRNTIKPWVRDERGEMTYRNWLGENAPLQLLQFYRNGELMAGEKVWVDFDGDSRSRTYGDLYYIDFGTGVAYLHQFQEFLQALGDLTGFGQGQDIGMSTLMGMLGPVPQQIGAMLNINPRRVGMPLTGPGQMGSFLQLRLPERPTFDPPILGKWPETGAEASMEKGLPRLLLHVRDSLQATVDSTRETPIVRGLVNEPMARAFIPWGRMIHELTDRDRSWGAYTYQALGLTPSKVNIFQEHASYMNRMNKEITTLISAPGRESLYRQRGGRIQFVGSEEDAKRDPRVLEANKLIEQVKQYDAMWEAWQSYFGRKHKQVDKPETIRGR